MDLRGEVKGFRKNLNIAVIGGGLVGSLAASFFAKRGHSVHIYEYREDIRKTPHVRGRTINLSLSHRGWMALQKLGLDEVVLEHGIALKGRMVHFLDGGLKRVIYDPNKGQCIYSVSRKYLNELLLTATEKYPNVQRHFQHKLIEADLIRGRLMFSQISRGSKIETSCDLVVGADGAFSTVRRHMMKEPLFNFSQTYIDHGYLELYIPATTNGNSALAQEYLHVWPREEFMMIALPNQDGSWTVTLFMPFKKFRTIDSKKRLLAFFHSNFPDAIPLIGEDRLVEDYFKEKASSLISIKCHPYHVGERAIIIGDAAHAMVPFYGQGMNAGFEDCLLLDNLLATMECGDAVKRFSDARCPDAHAICDLAMYNYVEMRSLLTRRWFSARRWLDVTLHAILGSNWLPLYTAVTFTDYPYTRCLLTKSKQDKIIKRAIMSAGIVGAGIGLYAMNLCLRIAYGFVEIIAEKWNEFYYF